MVKVLLYWKVLHHLIVAGLCLAERYRRVDLQGLSGRVLGVGLMPFGLEQVRRAPVAHMLDGNRHHSVELIGMSECFYDYAFAPTKSKSGYAKPSIWRYGR